MRIVRRMNRRMNSFRRNLVRASGWTLLLSPVFAIGILTPGCGGDEAPSPTVPGPAPTPAATLYAGAGGAIAGRSDESTVFGLRWGFH